MRQTAIKSVGHTDEGKTRPTFNCYFTPSPFSLQNNLFSDRAPCGVMAESLSCDGIVETAVVIIISLLAAPQFKAAKEEA